MVQHISPEALAADVSVVDEDALDILLSIGGAKWR
jgi:hypothetical protein